MELMSVVQVHRGQHAENISLDDSDRHLQDADGHEGCSAENSANSTAHSSAGQHLGSKIGDDVEDVTSRKVSSQTDSKRDSSREEGDRFDRDKRGANPTGAPGGKKNEAKSSLCFWIHLIVSPAIRVVLIATVHPIIWVGISM